MGPLISADAARRADEQVAALIDRGARVLRSFGAPTG